MRFYRTLPGGSTLDITSFFMNRSLVSRMLILGLPLLTVVLLLIFVATGSSIENIGIITTGLGGVFPADVLVGVVQELVPEASGKSSIAVVRPGADPRTAKHVFIITAY